MCPLLFGLIGTLLNFNGLKTGTVSKAIAIVCAGELQLCFQNMFQDLLRV